MGGHINGTLEECKNALHNVNAARIKVSANLKMCESLLDTMQNLEQNRKRQDLFVFGPNPIFSSAKEVELNYSITNQCVVEMLKELDISRAVALKNLQSARERTKKKKCKRLKWQRRQRYSKISPKRWEKKCRPGVPSKETTNYFCHFSHFVHCQGLCKNEECKCVESAKN